MAKDPDHLAGSFETENTGGLLSGFLAEEDISDRNTLWRLGSWGAATVGAVVVAVLANQSSIGLRREQVAATDLARQSQQIQSVAKESQIETRQLASAIDTLNSDRDRLYARVTVLEQGLDSVTGAIARQNSATPATPTVAAPAPSPAGPASPQGSAGLIGPPAPQNPTPAPTVAAVATTMAASPAAATAAERTSAEAKLREQAPAAKPPEQAATKVPEAAAAKPPEQVATKAAEPAATKPPEQAATRPAEPAATKAPGQAAPATVASIAPVAANASASTPPAPSASLMASKSMMVPPDAAASKLTEPEKPAKTITMAPIPHALASASSADHDEPDAAETTASRVAAIQRTEFGVDVGGANSLVGLRALWRGLLKYRANAALAKLRPIIVIREGHGGLGMQLRLVAGPLGDAAAAAKICAAMVENKRPCETTVFEGQRLAMNADESEAAGKPDATRPDAAKSDETKPDTVKSDAPKSPAIRPYSTRRRGLPKRAAVEEPPPKPEPTTFSSIFSRR
jgi:hypothetical protein